MSDNILIHGSSAYDSRKPLPPESFVDFRKYKQFSYWKNNKTFTYDSLYETGTYEIFAVFIDKVYDVDYQGFKYYKFYGSNNEQEFNDYVNKVKKLSIYDTGITPKYGDKLITLSMGYEPNYEDDDPSDDELEPFDNKFVIVAKKIK